ncbi:MAG: polyribonucleotide nucleotidyltransferase [Planctomycetota bacterium]|nr:MAG: polyribonucleotide nucleotidyltransferase [Planctomycetota bacterium]
MNSEQRLTVSSPPGSQLRLKLGSRKLELETGRIAKQANASVLVREGDNIVLVTVTATREPRPGIDFFPLVVEYREKMAAGGRIPGSFNRREGRITDQEILTCRLIDRSMRPLFPSGFRNEVQIQATVLSAHEAGDPASLALLGAGAALHLSDIPFEGPVLGSRSALYRGRTVLLPVRAERDEAESDLIVSVGPQGLVMVEGEAAEVADDAILEQLFTTIEELEQQRPLLDSWRQECGKAKFPFSSPETPSEWSEHVESQSGAGLREVIQIAGKSERNERTSALKEALLSSYDPEDESLADQRAAAAEIFKALQKRLMRERVVSENKRLDGRGPEEIRPIWGETGWLPRTHGSALFTRGETQSIVTCTLGSEKDRQLLDTVFGTRKESFLLHYNFPPYSVGEVRPLRGPGRREIGHGNLALRSLAQVLPGEDEFPYTIRVESEITESNGSSSMATVCGGTLALLDAGVPLARPVAGIAMGLIEEGNKIAVLSDILGDEDHLGDMDFKVTGTERGICALQMDNKIGGLTREVMEKAMLQARSGLGHILACMDEIHGAARKGIAEHAPQMRSIRIQPNLIGKLIGPKGATIKGIQETSGAQVSIDDGGLVKIYASEGHCAIKAYEMVQQLVGEVRVGESYEGTVTGVKDFGVFVKIYESAEGLVRQQDLKGQQPQQGSKLRVTVKGVDERGRIQLGLS